MGAGRDGTGGAASANTKRISKTCAKRFRMIYLTKKQNNGMDKDDRIWILFETLENKN